MKTNKNSTASPLLNVTDDDILPHVQEIKNLKELNRLGCHYINTANQGNYTRIITRSMRWLTVRRGNHYMSQEQERACQRIEELLTTDENNIDRQLNLNILLEKDPRYSNGSKEYVYIKNLIQIGADVRFVERESKVKLVQQENELYISFSNDFVKMVSIGYLYIGKNRADGICRYIANMFDRQFETAHKLTVKNDKIVIESANVGEQVRHAFQLSAREWVIIGIGFIASFIAGLILRTPLAG